MDKLELQKPDPEVKAIDTHRVICEETGKTYLLFSYIREGVGVALLKLDEWETQPNPSPNGE